MPSSRSASWPKSGLNQRHSAFSGARHSDSDRAHPRTPDSSERLCGRFCLDGALGALVAAPTAGNRSPSTVGPATLALSRSTVARPARLSGCPHGRGASCRGSRLGIVPGLGGPPRLSSGPSVIFLDLAINLQHVLFHAVPVLWRLHRMHPPTRVRRDDRRTFPSTRDPLSMAIKLGVIAALGTPAVWRCCCSRCCSMPPRFSAMAMSAAGRFDRIYAGSWSPPTCIASTIRSRRARPIPISVSICLGGIACSARIAQHLPPGTRR